MLAAPRSRPNRALASLVLALCLAACGDRPDSSEGASEDSPAAGRTPVVLVIVDTLRADHLACYGYGLETSPVLDAFAEKAHLFEANSTQCNSTFPSITSILTGLYPRTHRNYLPVQTSGTTVANERRPSLAERLGAAGYRTLAVVSHPSWRGDLERDGAVRRGWDAYSVIPDEIPVAERPLWAHGAYTNERAFALLDDFEAAGGDDPLLLWVHYFDPHTDLDNWVYDAPPAHRARFLAHHLAAVGLPEYEQHLAQRTPAERAAWIDANTEGDVHRRLRLADRRSLYDAEIASCDQQVGRLFERLRTMGVYDDALIVVMADHGENMEDEPADQGRIPFTHQRLYEPVAHTPLLIKLPGATRGATSRALTQNVDVLPTVLDLLGLPADPPTEGASLRPLLEDPRASVHERVFIESSDHVEKAVKTDRWKLIAPSEHAAPLVFDWRKDPGERDDLAAAHEDAPVPELQRALEAFRPHATYRVRFHPGDAPWTARLAVRFESLRVESLEGLPPTALHEDGHAVAADVAVAGEPVEIALHVRKHNSLTTWSLSRAGAVLRADEVLLGGVPLPDSTAIPVWAPSERPAPERPRLALERGSGSELAVTVLAEDGDAVELELRLLSPDYASSFDLLESEGFGPMQTVRASRVLRGAGPGLLRARVASGSPADEFLTLVRLDDAWPDPSEVSLDGRAVASDPVDFLFPFPFDRRLTEALRAGPAPDGVPPGSIEIWLESGTGPIAYDVESLDPEEAELLRQLGYLGEEDDDEDSPR